MKTPLFAAALAFLASAVVASNAHARPASAPFACYLKASLYAPQFEDDRSQSGALTELVDIAVGNDDYGTTKLATKDNRFRASINGPNYATTGKQIVELSIAVETGSESVPTVTTYAEGASLTAVTELPLSVSAKTAYARDLAEKCDPKREYRQLNEVSLVCGPKETLMGIHASSYSSAQGYCGDIRTPKK